MKTKRELLKHFAKYGNCEDIPCTGCLYYEAKHCPNDNVSFKRIGAMAILRMFPKKPTLNIGTKIEFENGEIGISHRQSVEDCKMTYCTYDTNCQNPIIIKKLIEEKEQLKAQIEKMRTCENCKHSYHDRYHTLHCLCNCVNFDKWELAE
jgi:hypothetical protein